MKCNLHRHNDPAPAEEGVEHVLSESEAFDIVRESDASLSGISRIDIRRDLAFAKRRCRALLGYRKRAKSLAKLGLSYRLRSQPRAGELPDPRLHRLADAHAIAILLGIPETIAALRKTFRYAATGRE